MPKELSPEGLSRLGVEIEVWRERQPQGRRSLKVFRDALRAAGVTVTDKAVYFWRTGKHPPDSENREALAVALGKTRSEIDLICDGSMAIGLGANAALPVPVLGSGSDRGEDQRNDRPTIEQNDAAPATVAALTEGSLVRRFVNWAQQEKSITLTATFMPRAWMLNLVLLALLLIAAAFSPIDPRHVLGAVAAFFGFTLLSAIEWISRSGWNGNWEKEYILLPPIGKAFYKLIVYIFLLMPILIAFGLYFFGWIFLFFLVLFHPDAIRNTPVLDWALLLLVSLVFGLGIWKWDTIKQRVEAYRW